jgi:hypothetical protein
VLLNVFQAYDEGSIPFTRSNHFKRLHSFWSGHSDKRAVAHSDKCPPSVRIARRFFAPASTCFIVRLA